MAGLLVHVLAALLRIGVGCRGDARHRQGGNQLSSRRGQPASSESVFHVALRESAFESCRTGTAFRLVWHNAAERERDAPHGRGAPRLVDGRPGVEAIRGHVRGFQFPLQRQVLRARARRAGSRCSARSSSRARAPRYQRSGCGSAGNRSIGGRPEARMSRAPNLLAQQRVEPPPAARRNRATPTSPVTSFTPSDVTTASVAKALGALEVARASRPSWPRCAPRAATRRGSGPRAPRRSGP